MADDRRPRSSGTAASWSARVQQARFTPQETALLVEARANSDVLVRTELAAMALFESTNPPVEANRAKAIFMLHDTTYQQAKARVMQPLSQFLQMADQRTLEAVHAAEVHATRMRLTFILFGLLVAALLWRAQRTLYAILGGPVSELYTRISELGCGNFSYATPVAKGMENSVLGWLSEAQINLARVNAQRKYAEAKNQRLTQLYAALSQCNQAVVRCTSEAELFEQVCRAVVSFGGMKMAWIGTLDVQSNQIKSIASFGSGTEYLDRLKISADAAKSSGRGPTGLAYHENLPFWCQDFQHDSTTAEWHERGAQYGWAASAALPLHRNGVVTWVFSLYAGVTNAFDQDVRNLLVKMAKDIDYALKSFEREKQREQAEARFQHLAHFDPLTGLPNRTQLDERANYAISLAQRSQSPVALMFLDLDHFKDINDSLGHSTGDALLIELAKRLPLVLREEDTVSRLGGDEFIFLLNGIDAQGAAHVAQKLLDTIAEPFRIEHHDLNVTGSIGIAVYPYDGADLETLFKNADTAMYRVKREGRNGYCFFTAEMQARSARTLLLANALRQAVERNQLHVHYQPQASMQDGRIVGAEALLRWTHPELGSISPAEFIPTAEDSGLILAIGEWVLRQAVRQAKRWTQDGNAPLVVAVNLSAMQFRQSDLPSVVTRILDEEGLAAKYLELELTEGVAMQDPQGAIAVMNNLHERGVRMSIDDFGTGYSSLSHLKKFKVYKLKIDQSFVRDIGTDPEDRAIVGAIIKVAKSLGLQTIAEGVETEGQLDFLREQGCDELQGYYFSKPLPADEFRKFAMATA